MLFFACIKLVVQTFTCIKWRRLEHQPKYDQIKHPKTSFHLGQAHPFSHQYHQSDSKVQMK